MTTETMAEGSCVPGSALPGTQLIRSEKEQTYYS